MHKDHNYTMCAEKFVGPASCDCGDTEAWKDNAHCALHRPTSKVYDVPIDMQQRARHAFGLVLNYAQDVLYDFSQKKPPEFSSSFLKLSEDIQYRDDRYTTMIYCENNNSVPGDLLLHLQTEENRSQIENFDSMIDKEGRCLVKSGPFQECKELQRVVELLANERGIRNVWVKVIHKYVVAHQMLAMKLISWLNGILVHCEGFRAIFAGVLVEQEVTESGKQLPSVLEGMLRCDSELWKAAKLNIHNLFITGLLREAASRKKFAIIFTKMYEEIVSDYNFGDKKCNNITVAGLSIHLFTVPTLAHYLVANQDLLAVLLRTLVPECESERKRNSKDKFGFERNLELAIRRANYVLVDLKYLLSVPPAEFDDNTRRGFWNGFSMMLDILSWMQGMDFHTRQVNQHIEREVDWENGFNLHIKLAPVITLLLNWCCSDTVTFLTTYRMLLKKLKEETKSDNFRTQTLELQGKFADCVAFNVATSPVSLHLPLCRLFAGMSLHLDKFGLKYAGDDFKFMEEEMPSLNLVLEMPLRTSVMVSQVHAGMWRRNGYSLQHQIFFYHNARCRGEMYDRDIQAMQFCAANMNHDSFLLQVLDKFGLLHWADTDFQVAEEESIRHHTSLVEEFFGFLVTVIGERFTPGVGDITNEDMVRKKIIQLLCVEPMSHSALKKALPEDANHEAGLEKIIDQVATFKKPVGPSSSKGVYELKEEFYKDYDVFFYHFTREDQSKSEEAQIARLKAANKPQVCTPPSLPPLSKNFYGLTFLLQSDLMLYLMKLVLQRVDDLKSRCFSESQLQKVLYLIGMALVEEERLTKDGTSTSFIFTNRALEVNMLEAMEELSGSQRIESHRELLAWTIRKFRSISGVEEKREVIEDTEEEEDEAKKKRAKAAAERRKRIMDQMASHQKNFMTENFQLFEDTPSGLRVRLASTCDWQDETSNNTSFPVCLGPNRSMSIPTKTSLTCILCQEEEEQLTTDNSTLVMASYCQKSTVLSRNRASTPPPSSPSTFPFLPSSLSSALHTTSCGHVMHATCWQKYFDDVSESERSRYRTHHPTSFDVEKSEFLCPLCRSLSNCVIPLIPQYHLLQRPGISQQR